MKTNMKLKYAALGVFLFVASLPARTWIVDLNNGPGTDFLHPMFALAAASDGDTIIIRNAVYPIAGVMSTSKGLTILGELRGGLFPPAIPPLNVSQIPAGKRFVMKRIGLLGGLWIHSCTGEIYLEEINGGITGRNFYPHTHTAPALRVEYCASVTLNRSALGGAPGILCRSSSLVVVESQVSGDSGRSGSAGMIYPSEAIAAELSQLVLAFGSTNGGSSTSVPLPGAEALFLVYTTLTVAGDAQTVIRPGIGTGPVSPAIIDAASGTMLIDPTIPIQGIRGGTVTYQRIGALRSSGVPPGGVLSAELYSPVGDLVFFFLATPGMPVLASPFGWLWLDPARIIYVGAGVQGPGEHLIHTIPVSPFAPRGRPLALQALHGGGGSYFALSTPTVVIIP